MIKWINLLHIYQPPYQDKEVIKQISQESYERILDILQRHKNAKITLNIQGCLTEQLIENGFLDIIEKIKKLAEKGQIELTGTAKFHPLLPLIPKKEIIRQIELNNKINKEAFGEIYNPKGFFLPEMAYSKEVAKIIYNLGFKWIILDEISLLNPQNPKIIKPQNNIKYFINDIGLQVVFRDREISKTYVPESILDLLNNNNSDQTIITATDGELYGHYHNNQTDFEQVLESNLIKTQTVSEYLDSLNNNENNIEWIDPIASSWESSLEEITRGIPYFLWNNPNNPIHQKLWEITNTAIDLMEKYSNDPNFYWAQRHLNYGLASCTFWWASAKKFHGLSIESWNPEEINKGVNQLLKSVRSLESAPKEKKIEIEYLAAEVKKNIWEIHWKRLNK